MKTTKLPLLMAAALLSILSITSCTKKKGCTDIDAANYNTNAEENDGSCTYIGDAIFWFDEATSQSLIDDDSFTLTYILDGETIGSESSSTFYNSEPNCGQPVGVSFDMGKEKTLTLPYVVKDQDDDVVFQGNLTLEGNYCTPVKLE